VDGVGARAVLSYLLAPVRRHRRETGIRAGGTYVRARGAVTLREIRFRESGRWPRDFIHGANCLAITYVLISEAPMVPPHSYRVAAIAAN
jgi:hypothetical protein